MFLDTQDQSTPPAMEEPLRRPSPATLYLIAGRRGAGKSTVAARLAARPGVCLFSEETLLGELYPDEMEAPGGHIGASIRLRHALKDHIVGLLRQGISVVLDFPANTPESRRWGRELFEAAGAAHELHLLDVPAMICEARLKARNTRRHNGATPRPLDAKRREEADLFFLPPLPQEGFNVVRHGE